MSKLNVRKVSLLVGLTLVAATGGLAVALDENIPIDQVPDAARVALMKMAAGAKFTEVEKETSNGVTVYEAEWQVKGVEYEVAVLADGTVVETEEEVSAEQTPRAVRDAATKAFGANAKVSYEKKTFVMYEIEGSVNGKGKEMLVSPTGGVHEEEDDDDVGEDDDKNGEDN